MKSFWMGVVFGALILFLGFQVYNLWVKPQKPLIVTETIFDTLTVHDTVTVSIPRKVYVENAPAVIAPDAPDVAYLDTLISISQDDLRIDTRLSLGFDMKQRLFGVALDFPLIEYPRDTVYIKTTARVLYLLPTKSKAWTYVGVALCGAAAGIIAYTLITAGR